MSILNKIKNLLRYWHIHYLRKNCKSRPEMNLSGTVLILAPHPDDEALGCGGLIARLCAEGKPPRVVIMTGGGGSLRGHSDMPENEVIEARRKLTIASARELGLPRENINFLDFIDGHISDRPEKEMARLREIIVRLQPSAILVPHRGEGWPDHTATREISRRGIENGEFRIENIGGEPLNDSGTTLQSPNRPQIIEYCVWMWYYNVWDLDWSNARKIEMTDAEHAAKLRAVDVYVSAKAPNGDPWSGFLPKPFLKANTSRRELYFINH